MKIPLDIPERTKMEGVWGVANQGHGKTQAIQYQIAELLPRVAKNECSIMVMDSQGLADDRLIAKIKNLQVFAPGQPLHGRLIHLNPRDLDYPVALNFFDVSHYTRGMTTIEKVATISGTVRSLNYLVGSIMGSDFTPRQKGLFEYLIHLLIAIPDATIYTLRDLLLPGSDKQIRHYLPLLDPNVRDFFENDFVDGPNKKGEYADVKQQILRRVRSILIDPILERMLSSQRTKINIANEFDRGCVLLIDTAKDLIGNNCEIIGRFWISQLSLVMQRRGRSGSKLTPVYVFVDEFQQYGRSGEELIVEMLEEGRKAFISLNLWHQRLDQIPEPMQNALSSTAIKFVGSVVHPNQIAKWAAMLQCSPEMIARLPRFTWATSVRNLTDRAASVFIEPFVMEKMPKMTAADAVRIAEEMRSKYCAPYRPPPLQAAHGVAGATQGSPGVLDPNAPVKPANWP